MVFVSNEGPGKAYNVRYGVRVGGVEYPSGPGRGTRFHVDPGENAGGSAIDVVAYEGWPGQERVRTSAVFYARYEDAEGNGWVTSSPANLERDMIRKPVLFPSLSERLRAIKRRNRRRAEAARRQRMPEQPASSAGDAGTAHRT